MFCFLDLVTRDLESCLVCVCKLSGNALLIVCYSLHFPKKWSVTILFKITTRMKLLFSNYLGDYSYSFQGSSELIRITVTVSLLLLQNGVTGKNSPLEFPSIFGNYSYIIYWFSNLKCNDFERNGISWCLIFGQAFKYGCQPKNDRLSSTPTL